MAERGSESISNLLVIAYSEACTALESNQQPIVAETLLKVINCVRLSIGVTKAEKVYLLRLATGLLPPSPSPLSMVSRENLKKVTVT
jgi:hypothetical protein